MTTPQRSVTSTAPSLNQVADDLLPKALGSLYYAAMYAAAMLQTDAMVALDLSDEQGRLLDRIARANLTPFPDDAAEAYQRRAWLDGAIERIHERHPLLQRYWDLHQRRLEFLPRPH